jgi:hypothetical protein
MPSKLTTPITCPYCGRQFFPYAHQVKRGKTIYCSRPCFNANFPTTDPVFRFWLKVDKNGPAIRPELGPCWLWTGGVDGGGYGQFRLVSTASMVKAHRYAWELATGQTIPETHEACHVCDIPNCVRNDTSGWYVVDGIFLPRRGHLFRGTPSENTKDAIAKGRHRNTKQVG